MDTLHLFDVFALMLVPCRYWVSLIFCVADCVPFSLLCLCWAELCDDDFYWVPSVIYLSDIYFAIILGQCGKMFVLEFYLEDSCTQHYHLVHRRFYGRNLVLRQCDRNLRP